MEGKSDSTGKGPVKQATELLKQRSEKINLSAELGKTKVVSKTASLSEQGGFYCETCDTLLKDSIAYMDHINGRKRKISLVSYVLNMLM